MGDPLRLRDTYAGMGVFINRHQADYDGFIFTGNQELAAQAGLDAENVQTFYSGHVECVLLEKPTISAEAEAGFSRRSAVR